MPRVRLSGQMFADLLRMKGHRCRVHAYRVEMSSAPEPDTGTIEGPFRRRSKVRARARLSSKIRKAHILNSSGKLAFGNQKYQIDANCAVATATVGAAPEVRSRLRADE